MERLDAGQPVAWANGAAESGMRCVPAGARAARRGGRARRSWPEEQPTPGAAGVARCGLGMRVVGRSCKALAPVKAARQRAQIQPTPLLLPKKITQHSFDI